MPTGPGRVPESRIATARLVMQLRDLNRFAAKANRHKIMGCQRNNAVSFAETAGIFGQTAVHETVVCIRCVSRTSGH